MAEKNHVQSVGWLAIQPSADGNSLSYQFRSTQQEQAVGPLSKLEDTRQFAQALQSTFFAPDTTGAQVEKLATRFAIQALPPRILDVLEKWTTVTPTPLIIVETEPAAVSDLPWELLSAAFRQSIFVVRKPSQPKKVKRPNLSNVFTLLTGWPTLFGGEKLEGVMREIGQIPARFGNTPHTKFKGIVSPTIDEIQSQIVKMNPDIIHLAVANGFSVDIEKGSSSLVLDPKPDTKAAGRDSFLQLSDKQLIQFLESVENLSLCIVNAMPQPVVSSTPLYRKLSEELGTAVIGWAGALQDTIAVDFALFFYQRLIENQPLIPALRAFSEHYSQDQWVSGAMPVVWIPDAKWITQPILQAADSASGVTRSRSAMRTQQKPALDVKLTITPQPSLFPSLLVNKKPIFKELALDTNAAFTARIEALCDIGGRTSALRETRNLVTGLNPIFVQSAPFTEPQSIQFPVLYELIDSDERRIISFQVSVWADDELVVETTRSVLWRARREWLDTDDVWPYVPSFVLPMSQAVADLVREAERMLALIGSPKTRFSGYATRQKDRADNADLQLKAIFQALRDRRIKYIAPPGNPVYVVDPANLASISDRKLRQQSKSDAEDISLIVEKRISGQLVRLPEDVASREHGTCHDLALFMAAAAEYVNLRPLIIMYPGHTFLGLWLDSKLQETFWREKETHRPSGSRLGDQWMILPDELEELVKKKKAIRLIEATLVTEPNATYERSAKVAEVYLQRGLDAVIDIWASRREIQPLSIR